MLRTDGSRFEPDRRCFSGTLLNECHTGGDIRQQPEGVPAGQNLDRTRYPHLFLSYPAKTSRFGPRSALSVSPSSFGFRDRSSFSTHASSREIQVNSNFHRLHLESPHSARVISHRGYTIAKRVMDLVLCCIALPLVAPVLCACMVAIRLETRGPIFFVQHRTGRFGRRFPMLKLRTMVENADELKKSLIQKNDLQWPDFKMARDPRITKVGSFLRKTSLDELPQIINVLKGDMSLVGPRPTSFDVSTYQLWHTERLEVLPGITGLWQISGRSDIGFDERVRLDREYIRNKSLLLDCRILLMTFFSVVRRKGAY